MSLPVQLLIMFIGLSYWLLYKDMNTSIYLIGSFIIINRILVYPSSTWVFADLSLWLSLFTQLTNGICEARRLEASRAVTLLSEQILYELLDSIPRQQFFVLFLFTGTVISPSPPFLSPMSRAPSFPTLKCFPVKTKRRFVDVEYARSWRESAWKRGLSRWVSKEKEVGEIAGLWKFYKRNWLKLRK